MLIFKQVEKRLQDVTLIPKFDLRIGAGEIIAIYLQVNMREHLLRLLSLQTVPSNGEIYVDTYPLTRTNKNAIQIVHLEPSLYPYLKVKEMLQFMKDMHDSDQDIVALIQFISLEEQMHMKISNLSYAEKKRLQLGCSLLVDAPIYFFEDPDQNLDLESKYILIKGMQKLQKKGKTICILTTNMESALSFSESVYRFVEQGLKKIEIKEELEENIEEISKPVQLEKIPSKIDDKIVLFDPLEIDYIESYDGTSYLYIKGDKFPSVATLQELEGRLIPFGFFRCHRSYIVNLQKVREVVTWTRNSYSLILDNKEKTTIPLSKAKMTALKNILNM